VRIKTVGCGNAFSNKSFNQSFVVEEDGRKMLIDCGMQTPHALTAAGYKAKDIDDIYISHLHADHIGGLEYFAFLRYDWMKHPRKWNEGYDTSNVIVDLMFGKNIKSYAPTLIGNKQLLTDLWDKSLRGGLESMEGFVATLETFFQPFPVEPNKPFMWQGWKVDLIQQIHIMSGSVITPSFGIMFSKEGHKSVYFVTDSQHCSPRQQEEYYKRADLIFQDCECTGVNFIYEEGAKYYLRDDPKYPRQPQVTPWPTDDMDSLELSAKGIDPLEWEIFKFGSGVHANYAQLAGYPSANSVKLSKEIKAKMMLSHYQDFVLENKDMYGYSVNWDDRAKKDGFAGFVKLGQEFEL